jgi:hypothetical protein
MRRMLFKSEMVMIMMVTDCVLNFPEEEVEVVGVEVGVNVDEVGEIAVDVVAIVDEALLLADLNIVSS